MAVDVTAAADALAAIGRAAMTDRLEDREARDRVDLAIPVVRLFRPVAAPVLEMAREVLDQVLASRLRRLLPVTVDAGKKSRPARDLLPVRFHRRHRHVRLMTTDAAAVADVSYLRHSRPLAYQRPYKITESPPDDGDFVFCKCNFTFARYAVLNFLLPHGI